MKKLVLKLLHTYKASYPFRSFFVHMFVGPDGSECRFTPTCSEYMTAAVEKYGAGKGLLMGFKRLLRCNPWSKGGYDPIA